MNCVLFAKMNKVFSLKKKKILEKWQKILEKSGNFVIRERWEPWYYQGCKAQGKRKFECSFFRQGSTGNCQTISKICFYTGNLPPTQWNF